MTDDLLADTIGAGVAEGLRNNGDRHSKWRTGTVVSAVDPTSTMRQVEVQIDGDPNTQTTKMRSVNSVSVGQRVLVTYSNGGGVWCMGALGGTPDEPVSGGGCPLVLLGEARTSPFDPAARLTWFDAGGHNYTAATLAVPCTAGVPILFQFTWTLDCGADTADTFARIKLINYGTDDNFEPYILDGRYMRDNSDLSYYETTQWASLMPTVDGTVNATLNAQFSNPATNLVSGHSMNDVVIRAFGTGDCGGGGGGVVVPATGAVSHLQVWDGTLGAGDTWLSGDTPDGVFWDDASEVFGTDIEIHQYGGTTGATGFSAIRLLTPGLYTASLHWEIFVAAATPGVLTSAQMGWCPDPVACLWSATTFPNPQVEDFWAANSTITFYVWPEDLDVSPCEIFAYPEATTAGAGVKWGYLAYATVIGPFPAKPYML